MNETVTIALPSDFTNLMAFLRLMHKENAIAPIVEKRVENILSRGLARDNAVIGVIRGPSGIEASTGLYLGNFWYSDSIHIEDLWCFVHPDHRRTSHAKDLLNFARWASTELGKPLLMGVLSTERTSAKVRLYNRALGAPAGALFVVNAILPDAVAPLATA